MTGNVTLAVSVVVPTYRRPDLLSRCLEALLQQDFDGGDFEIIVADDGPDEATKAVVLQFAERSAGRPLLRYLPVTDSQGPAGARNRGWRTARGRVIAFTDDDTVPAPDWLREGVKALDSGLVAVAGRIEVPLPPEPSDYERDAGGLAAGEFATANVFVRYSALAAIGGFDERFRLAWREDSDLQFALMEWGGAIGRAPKAVVRHPVRPAPWGVSLQQQKKVMFDALLYKKHPRLYRERVRRGIRWDYYLIVLLLLAGAVAALVGQGLAAGLCLATWALLTLRFALQRLRGTRRDFAHVAEMLWTSALIPPVATYWRLVGAWRYRVWFL